MAYVSDLIDWIVIVLNGMSIIVLLLGIARGTVQFIKNELTVAAPQQIKLIKNQLGTYVLLSLEILIAADIIETILDPSLEDIFILATIVIIRTIISYFLGKEIESTPS